jgi:KDO2-lipid IV(A) lauroyltransferase
MMKSIGPRFARAIQIAADYAAYWLVRALVAVVQTLPEDRVDRFCRVLSVWLTDRIPLRGDVLAENLQRIFPSASAEQRRRLAQQMWHHLLLMACEFCWAPRRIHRHNWEQFVRIPDSHTILGLLLDSRPTVLVTGHFGNFELAGYVTGLFGIHTMTIARPLDNRLLDHYVTEGRRRYGQVLVPKDGSAPLVDRHLSEGGTLSLLADQHAGNKGCWVDFLGHPASCHKALALFSLAGDAPLVVTSMRRVGPPMSFELTVSGIADPRSNGPEVSGVRALTTWYNQRLAKAIALAPEQYWWLHRRWRKPPRRVRQRAA